MSWRDLAPKSLKARLALGVVAGVLLVLSSSFVVLHLVIRDEMYRHLDEDMATQMRAVAEYAAANPGRESVTGYMPQFRTRAHQDFFQVWDGNGRPLARSDVLTQQTGRSSVAAVPLTQFGPRCHTERSAGCGR